MPRFVCPFPGCEREPALGYDHCPGHVLPEDPRVSLEELEATLEP